MDSDQDYRALLDRRDIELERLKKERDAWRTRSRLARAEAVEAQKRFSELVSASKTFASSVRTGTDERRRSQRRLAVQYGIGRLRAEAGDLDETIPKILKALGEGLGWELCAFWAVDEDAGVLRCEELWSSPDTTLGAFETACRRASVPRGVDLPGLVWERGEPVWVEDVLEEDDFLREAAAEENLRGALAFPVLNGDIRGVFELFDRDVLPPDGDLLRTITIIGNQVGQFVERRRTEEKLRESEERFRTFFNTAAVGAAQVDPATGRYLQVNDNLCRFLGYDEHELLSMTFFQVTHPDDLAREQEGLSRLLRGEIQEHITEKRYLQKDGRTVWAQLAVSLVRDTDGSPLYTVAVIQDATERKRSEEQILFQARLLEQFKAAVIATDLRGTVTHWNKYAEVLYGWSREEVLGRNIVELTVGPTEAEVAEEIMEQLRAGEAWAGEFVTRRKDGSTFSAYVTNSLVYDAQDHTAGIVGVSTDITERKQAEAELLALKDRLDADLSAMTRLHELSTRLLAASELQLLLEEVLDASIKLQGADFGNIQLYDRETGKLEIVAQRGFGQEFLDYFGNTDEGAACGRALKQGERVIIEDVEKDAEYKPHRQIAASAGYRAVQSTPLVDRNGETLGILSTHFRQPHRPSQRELRITDLHARQATEMIGFKLSEEALRESEERYRALYEDNPSIYFTLDTEGKIRSVNRFGAEQLGYAVEELVGRPMLDLFHEEDREGASRYFDACLRNPERIDAWEARKVRNDGSVLWVRENARVVQGPDGGKIMLVSCEDITQRRRAEEALQYQFDLIRTITSNAADSLFLWDAEGRVTFMNPAAVQTFGWRQEELLGESLHDRVHHHPDGRPYPMSECPLVRVAESGQALHDHEDLFFHKDGSPIDVACSHAPIVVEGRITGAVLVVRDITERKRAEEERERSLARELELRAQAEERRRISRELHDRVAHTIAVVHQSLELHEALKERDPTMAEAKMELARKTVKEALTTTRNLSMELRRPEVRRGLESALANLLRNIVPPMVHSEVCVDGDETLIPAHTRNQLFLILREAIRNAVAHSGCDRVAVELDINPDRVVGSVEDDGRGFDPDGTRSADGGGQRSMEERAALVGGAVGVSSTSGGTKIKVSVPLEGA